MCKGDNYCPLLFIVDVSTKVVGPMEETGFTHAYNVEPVTFNPNNPHLADKPVSISFKNWHDFSKKKFEKDTEIVINSS